MALHPRKGCVQVLVYPWASQARAYGLLFFQKYLLPEKKMIGFKKMTAKSKLIDV